MLASKGGFALAALRVHWLWQIDVVHAHTTFSSIAFESVLHGRTMGLPVVFTDHSLFGFANITAIMSNKLLSYAMHDVHRAICVSHTAKENTVLRCGRMEPCQFAPRSD